jgi:hypothetical protein
MDNWSRIWSNKFSKGSVARIFPLVWGALGSSHFANIAALLTLFVTVYLTWYIFGYTNRQLDSSIKVSASIVPRVAVPPDQNAVRAGDRFEWMVSINLHNSGPADISTSSLFLDVATSPSIELMGFEAKDWTAMVRDPQWQDPPPTPWPSEFGNYIIPLNEFESGDNYAINLLFSVSGPLSVDLWQRWSALRIRAVVSAESGGYYHDHTHVDSKKYAELEAYFIKHLSISGQHVSYYGDLPIPP